MRPLIAEINLAHLRENYQTLKKLHGGKLFAVLKADAYGHGSVRCAQALTDIADAFAVACIEEALTLREQGVSNPILLLEGVFEADEYALVDQHNLWIVVQSQYQLENLLTYSWQNPIKVWLKMDTGMGRVGFLPQDYTNAYSQLRNSKNVSDIVKMTHFACADEPTKSKTDEQIAIFDQVCASLEGEESMANSAGILAYPKAHRDWGRTGIAMYGISPLVEKEDAVPILKPVMTLKTKVFTVRQVKSGSSIGYGATYIAPEDTLAGVIACGYADGYPRVSAAGAPVMVDGQLSRILGRMSMDMAVVDLTHLEDAYQGCEVELWGEQISVCEIAQRAQTIAYELLCSVKRAKFIYIKGNAL